MTITLVADKAEVFERIKAVWPALSKLGVRRIGLFGSFVRGEQRENSDIDLLVEFKREEKTFRNFMGAADLLEDVLGRRVDFVTRESLSRHLGPYIRREVENVEVGDSPFPAHP